MIYTKVESSLVESTKYLNNIVARREKLIKESRDIISLSSQTIVTLHASDFKGALILHKQAKLRLEELRRVAGLDLVKYLTTPEQEFVESSAIYAIKAKRPIPSVGELKVLPSSYILGLLDAIGELKRSVYDSIRKGNLKEAEDLFSTMESLFSLISPFAIYDSIIQGVRRKLDVARMLIEDTRAIVTEEVRRQDFMAAVEKFSERVGSSSPVVSSRARRPRVSANLPGVATVNPENDDSEGTQK
ncbi:MAG: RNA-binding protein [Nitrososphaerales archaeon]